MRTLVAVLALAFVLLTVLAPAIEAIGGCLELCPDESPVQDQCSRDACCSCCVHSGPLFATLPLPSLTLELAGSTAPPDPPSLPLARSADILHVPRLSAA
jgi:hypothetical protein